MNAAALLFLDLALILLLAKALGTLAARVGQPAVVGEILAGLLLGPTLFGTGLTEVLIPLEVRPALGALANLGLALFMFAVGLELEQLGRARAAIGVAAASTALPLVLGAGLGLLLVAHRDLADPVGFTLFFAVAMAVTAFPVLARILTERDLHRAPLGSLALAAASIGDVLAWSLLILVVTLVNPAGASPWLLLLLLPYALALLAARRLLVRRRAGFPVVFIGMLASAWLTELVGLHFIFGAFLFGAVLPRTPGHAELTSQARRFGALLLPVYFVVAGFQVDLSGMGSASLLTLAAILLVAIGGKLGGGYLGGRLAGLDNRQALGMGALMNTRGLTELVVLTVGLQLRLLDSELYSLLVLMAVLTTAMTGPLLTVLLRTAPAPGGPKERGFLSVSRRTSR